MKTITSTTIESANVFSEDFTQYWNFCNENLSKLQARYMVLVVEKVKLFQHQFVNLHYEY